MRAEKLDEGLAIYDGLMRGQPFSYAGKHYSVEPTEFFPPPAPVQQPRVPVWVVGAYPAPRSMARAARWDGVIPTKLDRTDENPFGPADLPRMVAALKGVRGGCLLLVSDMVIDGTFTRISDEEMRAAVDRTTRIALAVATGAKRAAPA